MNFIFKNIQVGSVWARRSYSQNMKLCSRKKKGKDENFLKNLAALFTLLFIVK